jgi:hypothetical protein
MLSTEGGIKVSIATPSTRPENIVFDEPSDESNDGVQYD